MTNDNIIKTAAQLTHCFFLQEFAIAQSDSPNNNLRKDTADVVKEIFEGYINDILKKQLEHLTPSI